MTDRKMSELETPALLLEQGRMKNNIARMRERITRLKVGFRPHVKTAKCLEVALAMSGGTPGPITVSTLHEADYFADRGFTDILYAVGITPNKMGHVAALLKRGAKLTVILDSIEAAVALAQAAAALPMPLSVLIEIDCDGHRAGILPESPDLLAVAQMLAAGGVTVAGVMTHAGGSYDCRGDTALRAMAEQERARTLRAAERLRQAGHAAPVVSVGSTPTALFAQDLTGVTEVRAGVFVFFDLVMAGLGVCRVDDIALSVLSTVIGHQREKGWTIVDAGWMAMSRDRGTAAQTVDQGFGLVCDVNGKAMPDYIMVSANQEHGIIAHRHGTNGTALDLPLGALLRILPNHACATAAQHARYHVVDGTPAVTAVWERISGW
ncbi:MAG: DSD1 family PLP-dependent enzyme [Betaproteobacteria bacterium]|nr:DSD1 family PLP-dependent enzyme [Betaproteobacteria bacterium]